MANRQRLSLATEDYFLVGNEPGEAYTMDFSPQIVPTPRPIDLLQGRRFSPGFARPSNRNHLRRLQRHTRWGVDLTVVVKFDDLNIRKIFGCFGQNASSERHQGKIGATITPFRSTAKSSISSRFSAVKPVVPTTAGIPPPMPL